MTRKKRIWIASLLFVMLFIIGFLSYWKIYDILLPSAGILVTVSNNFIRITAPLWFGIVFGITPLWILLVYEFVGRKEGSTLWIISGFVIIFMVAGFLLRCLLLSGMILDNHVTAVQLPGNSYVTMDLGQLNYPPFMFLGQVAGSMIAYYALRRKAVSLSK